jgi:hypothetical protein
VNARVLELLSKKQKALYEGLLIAGDSDPTVERQTVADVKNLSDRVKEELRQAGDNAPVHPRNQFTLLAIDPLLKYDNALTLAIQAYFNGDFTNGTVEEKTSAIEPMVHQIVEAEEELRVMAVPDNFSQVEGYLLLTRILMLNNAYLIMKTASGENPGPGMKAYIDAHFPQYAAAYNGIKALSADEKRILGEYANEPNLILAPF